VLCLLGRASTHWFRLVKIVPLAFTRATAGIRASVLGTGNLNSAEPHTQRLIGALYRSQQHPSQHKDKSNEDND
jgi:hypothetical protein